MSSQILVAGAAGFIGSHVCRHLLNQGGQVVGFEGIEVRKNLPLSWVTLKRKSN